MPYGRFDLHYCPVSCNALNMNILIEQNLLPFYKLDFCSKEINKWLITVVPYIRFYYKSDVHSVFLDEIFPQIDENLRYLHLTLVSKQHLYLN